MKIRLLLASLGALVAATTRVPASSLVKSAPVEIRLGQPLSNNALPADFIGLSFETQRLLPREDGSYYFSEDNKQLLNLFRTLGVKSLRIGGNTADRPTVPFPNEEQIDRLFAFARKAGVKVIFTLRLREGNPRLAGAVARHIVAKHADVLACFAIGNEPNVFAPEYPAFLAAWKRFADVVNSPEFAPAARYAGPSSTAGKSSWTRDFAQEFSGTGKLLVATQHIYPGGNADLVADPAEARRLMLSREWVEGYQKFHDSFAPGVLATGIPYRLGETNSFWNGGRADASNTFAAALWSLDYLHWWAAHGAGGLNLHTGDFVAKSEENTRCMYAAFWSTPRGYDAKPVAYGITTFRLGAQGKTIRAEIVENSAALNLTAYAFGANDSEYVTLINKEYGPAARAASVTLAASPDATSAILRLITPDGDVARKTGLTLGGDGINEAGTWSGRWSGSSSVGKAGKIVIEVPAASAVVIKVSKK